MGNAARGFLTLLLLAPAAVGAGGERPCPEGMAAVPGSRSCIDKYEWPNIEGWRPTVGISAIPSPWDERRGTIMDARSLCASAGKRMCRMEEWTASCRGKGGAKYPFGRRLPKLKDQAEAPCNYARWFRTPDYGKVWIRDSQEMERLYQADRSGARGCESASGAQDMMGNVEEWIECPEWMSPNCDGPRGSSSRRCYCLAGRFWSKPAACDKMITGHDPAYYDYESGTRCCADL